MFVTGLGERARSLPRTRRAASSTSCGSRCRSARASAATAATNAFVPARVLVPIQPAHDRPHALRRRARPAGSCETRDRSDARPKDSPGSIAGLPTSLLVDDDAIADPHDRLRARRTCAGSPVPLYLAGARILGSYPMGPRTGCALTVTMLSYCDDVHIGLNIDPGRDRRRRRVHARRARRVRDLCRAPREPTLISGETCGPGATPASSHSSKSGSRQCGCSQSRRARRRRTGAASALRRPDRCSSVPHGCGGAASSRSMSATDASTRQRQSGTPKRSRLRVRRSAGTGTRSRARRARPRSRPHP